MLYLLSLTLIFSFVLCLIFLRQRHIVSTEITIFKYMLISNFCGLIIELILKVLCFNLSTASIYVHLFSRLYLFYLIFFGILFSSYVYIISTMDYKKTFKSFLIVNILFSVGSFVVSCFLPLYFDGLNTDYCYGPAVNCM